MTDNNDFDIRTYKDQAGNIKLSGNQKEILLNKMRVTDRQLENEKNKPKKNQIFKTTWTRAAAALVAVALLGTVCCYGFLNYKKTKDSNVSATSEVGKINDNNIFSITANAAEIENKSVIGVFSGINGGQFLMKDFNSKDTFYHNKQGNVDYFNDYELTELNIKGSNIESVSFNIDKKSIYFAVSPYMFANTEDKTNNDSYKIYGYGYSECEMIAKAGYFSDYDRLLNSQYTKKEFNEHSDGLYGEFCDGFTYTLKNPSDREQIIEIGKAISLVTETDRTDDEIDEWMNDYCNLNDELLKARAENRKHNGEYGEVSDEENEIEQKMQKLNNKMVKKTVDGAVIDVTVKFTDGSKQTQKINLGFYENPQKGMYINPGVTFSV